MSNNKIRISAALAAFIITTVIGGAYTYAHSGRNPEAYKAMKTAIESNDYTAFINAVGADSKLAGEVTEDEFSTFVEAKQLKEEGNIEEAQALLEEIGVTKGFRKGKHHRKQFDTEKHEAIEAAIEANDYAAWLAAVGDTPKAEMITEETFPILVEIHQLKEAGDHEGARDLMEEIGFKKPGSRFHKHR
jgi:ABC-type transport system substrate-binding protein